MNFTEHDHNLHHGSHDHAAHNDMVNEITPFMEDTMDMSHHSAHGSHINMEHMMSMAFHSGYNETILFEQWKTASVSGLLWSMLAIFLMGVLYEGLKYYREYLFWKTYNALQYRAVTIPEKNVVSDESARVVHMVGEVIHKQPPSMLSWMHAFQTFLHILQVTLSFLLMLIFMTYNVWLCLAVVIGAAVGYFLFGWRKSVIVDVTEHCH